MVRFNWKDRASYKKRSFVKASDRVRLSRRLAAFTKLAFLTVIGIFLAGFIALPLLSFNLPSPDKIVRKEGFATEISDRNGKVLYDVYSNQKRIPIEMSDVPLYLKQATIAIEDKTFYSHQGFDPLGMARSVYYVFRYRRSLQGGSTLTQQLVKNVLLTPERSVFRKIREFILAVQIERKYTKDDILQMYLNEAPYGGTAWGVEAASEMYFGKKTKDINLVESAILAGMPQSPTKYSPYSSTPKAYIGRTQAVLRRMREDNYITVEQEKAANNELQKFTFQSQGGKINAPHFVQYVQKLLVERYGENIVEQGGLRVTTTLNLDLQDKVQAIVSEEIAKVEKQRIGNGAAVVINPETGEILAMVGSKNFRDKNYDGQVNVTMSLRQPGSTFKPFTYVTAFKENYTPATLLMDVATTFQDGSGQPDYNPVNYDGKYRGPIQVRYALANSINVAAVKMLGMVGIKDVLSTAYDMGISTLPPTAETLSRVGLSMTLGGGEVRLLELSGAFCGFVNKGYRVDPIGILKVTDIDGKVLEETKPIKGRKVLTEEQAYLIESILSDNDARKEIFGTNSLLNIPGRTVMVKTGTTNDKRDNWTVGGNNDAMVGVWVGNNDNSPMLNVASGVSGASPIWRRSLLEALKGKTDRAFDVPAGIVKADVDSLSGFASHDGFASRSEIFIKGTEPGADKVHVRLKVCKSEGKLATPSDIAGGNYDDREFYVFKENDPVSGDGKNRWQEGIDAWVSGQSDSKYHSPTDFCGTSNPLNVEFTNPTDRNSNLDNNFNIRFSADSSSDIVRAELYIDGNNVRNFDGPPFSYDATGISTGVHTIKAVAKDSAGHQSDRVITVGVKVAWDYSPTPTPTPTLTLTP